MSNTRKASVRRYFEDVLSTRRLESADELLTDDVRVSAPGSELIGVTALKEMLTETGKAFPHRDVKLEEPIEDGDQVACVFRLVMEHIGDYQGLAATGKTIDITGVDVFTFEGERISEIRVFYDATSIMQQLGVVDGAASG